MELWSPISPIVLEGIPILGDGLATQVMEKMPFEDNSVDVVVGTLLLLTQHAARCVGDNDIHQYLSIVWLENQTIIITSSNFLYIISIIII